MPFTFPMLFRNIVIVGIDPPCRNVVSLAMVDQTDATIPRDDQTHATYNP
jgi:hypothetical protein